MHSLVAHWINPRLPSSKLQVQISMCRILVDGIILAGPCFGFARNDFLFVVIVSFFNLSLIIEIQMTNNRPSHWSYSIQIFKFKIVILLLKTNKR